MTDDALTQALDRIATRLDALERKVDAISPAAGDTLGARVGDPAVRDGLARLLDRVENVEAMVDTLGTFASRVPVVADAAGTTAAWAWSEAEARGVDPIASGQRAAGLLVEASREENLALVERLLAKRATLESALDALDAVDPKDLDTVTRQGAALTGKLAALLRIPELASLLDAGADAKALTTARFATTALVETRGQPIESVGPIGALMKLGDTDVKRAVGFTLSLAKRFGQLLDR